MKRSVNALFKATLLLSLAAGTPLMAAEVVKQEAEQAQPASTTDATKATKTRSNIQNNREVPAQDALTAAPSDVVAVPEAEAVVKTKTKSNQSND